jgi:hypothetical protein
MGAATPMVRRPVTTRRGQGSGGVYVVALARIGSLLRPLGGAEDDDVLDALAAYYQQHGGLFNEPLRGPEIAAEFDNWYS